MTFDILKSRMLANADRVAVASGGREHTYRMLADEVDRQAQAFRAAGVGPGQLVTLVGEFSFEALAALLALLFCRATVVPLTRTAQGKLGRYVDELGPDFGVDAYDGSIRRHAAVRAAPATVAEAPPAAWRSILPREAGGLIVFTSGSTGVPKAIVHDIDALCYRYLEPRAPLSSICFLLFDHMGGINTVLSLLFRGGTAVNVATRQVDVVCEAIQRYRVQLLPATPSFLSQLLLSRAVDRYDLSSLQVISYGTEVMSEAVLRKLTQLLPGCRFKQTYGLSETGVLQIQSRANDSLWFRFIDAGVATRVTDDVLWIKTRSNLLGKVLFTDTGLVLDRQGDDWFCTNDLVVTDGDWLMVLGRQTDIVNVGGLKVYPSEVENCIHELPFVDDVFVKGKKNPLLGQTVVAYVQLADGADRNDAERRIKQHCAGRLERYKVPSQLIFQWVNFVNDRFKKVRTA